MGRKYNYNNINPHTTFWLSQPKLKNILRSEEQFGKLNNGTPKNKSVYNFKRGSADGLDKEILFMLHSFRFSKQDLHRIIIILVLLYLARQTYAQCEPPKGSYRDTCRVTGKQYESSDVNLAKVKLCKFDLDCAQVVAGKRIQTVTYLPATMKDCLGYIENCNGNPVIRKNGNDYACRGATESDIKKNVEQAEREGLKIEL